MQVPGDSDDDSISSSLKRRVADIDALLLDDKIARAVQKVFDKALKDPKHEDIVKISREHSKLTGDVANTSKEINALRRITQSLQWQANEATDSAKVQYATIARTLTEVKDKSILEIEEAIAKGPTL